MTKIKESPRPLIYKALDEFLSGTWGERWLASCSYSQVEPSVMASVIAREMEVMRPMPGLDRRRMKAVASQLKRGQGDRYLSIRLGYSQPETPEETPVNRRVKAFLENWGHCFRKVVKA